MDNPIVWQKELLGGESTRLSVYGGILELHTHEENGIRHVEGTDKKEKVKMKMQFNAEHISEGDVKETAERVLDIYRDDLDSRSFFEALSGVLVRKGREEEDELMAQPMECLKYLECEGSLMVRLRDRIIDEYEDLRGSIPFKRGQLIGKYSYADNEGNKKFVLERQSGLLDKPFSTRSETWHFDKSFRCASVREFLEQFDWVKERKKLKEQKKAVVPETDVPGKRTMRV